MTRLQLGLPRVHNASMRPNPRPARLAQRAPSRALPLGADRLEPSSSPALPYSRESREGGARAGERAGDVGGVVRVGDEHGAHGGVVAEAPGFLEVEEHALEEAEEGVDVVIRDRGGGGRGEGGGFEVEVDGGSHW